MSVVASVPETIAELSALVSSGDIPAARKLGRKLINQADTHDLWLIAKVANVLEERPRTAVDILRHWWSTAPTDTDRAIIAACAPKDGAQRHPAKPATNRTIRRSNHRPRPVSTEQRNDVRRRRRTRQEQADAAAMARYQAERAGQAEGSQIPDRDEAAQAEQVYASGFDYDSAALYGTTESRCLSCSIGRERYDLDRTRLQAGHGDDGLCAECREIGRPGIPELPAGHTYLENIAARCAFIRAELGDAAARVVLRTEWQRTRRLGVRAAIADYVTAYLPEKVTAPALPVCELCESTLTPRDMRNPTTDGSRCTDCRTFSAEVDAHEAAADEADARGATATAATTDSAAQEAAAA